MIRPYIQSDWLSICVIHDQARKDELRDSVGLEAFLTLEETYQNEGLFDGEVWVYEYEKSVLGFIAINGDELTWLYVSPEHYNKGIGRAMLQKVFENSKSTIYTEVLCGNENALQFYLKLGFEIVERTKGRLAGNEKFEAEAYYLKKEIA